MIRRLAIAAWLGALAGPALADPEQRSEQALHAAQQRAVAGDPGAIEALEQLGADRPITRWTDDAWRSAAQLAERTGDYARARRDLEQVVATTTDEQSRVRASTDLARLAEMTGAAGEWTTTAARHDDLARSVRSGRGDPAPALRELEALVRTHPTYPNAVNVMLVIAQGWERDGEPDRAIAWLREAARLAPVPDRTRTRAELARALIRNHDLAGARTTIATIADPLLVNQLREAIASAERRRALRSVMLGVLAGVLALGVTSLRRSAGSWRAALRKLLRPPIEAIYYLPIAALLAAIAQTGNPAVARAVIAIAMVGAAVAWLSGAILEDRPRPSMARLVLHGGVAAITVLAATYLVIDQARLTDLLLETWRGGPALR